MTVIDQRASPGEAKIRFRWRKDTLREVSVLEGRTVVKRFWIKPGCRSYPRPWINEHEALRLLEGDGFARSSGYTESEADGGKLITYKKEFVEGEPLDSISEDDVRRLAAVLTLLHKRGVVLDDASRSNFVKDSVGTIRCIDFGRALIFPKRNLFFYYSVGRELGKFLRETLAGNRPLFRVFLECYFAFGPFSRLETGLIMFSYRFASSTRQVRKLLQGQSDAGGAMRGPARYAWGQYFIRPDLEPKDRLEEFIHALEFLKCDFGPPARSGAYEESKACFRMDGKGPRLILRLLKQAGGAEARDGSSIGRGRESMRKVLDGALRLERAGIPAIRPLACWTYRGDDSAACQYVLISWENIESSFAEFKARVQSQGSAESGRRILRVLIDRMACLVAEIHENGLGFCGAVGDSFLVLRQPRRDPGEDEATTYSLCVARPEDVGESFLGRMFRRSRLDAGCLKKLALDSQEEDVFCSAYHGARQRMSGSRGKGRR